MGWAPATRGKSTPAVCRVRRSACSARPASSASPTGACTRSSRAAACYPSFGSFDGKSISMFDQGAGVIRALDVVLNGEQKGGQDFILGWNPNSGQFAQGYPAVINDLGFLTGESVGDITGHAPQQEVLGGTASLDVQAFNSS